MNENGLPGSSSRTAGAFFREQRRRAGLTQIQLAEAGGLSVGTIRDLEQGRTSRPRSATLRRLAQILDGVIPDPAVLPGNVLPGLVAGTGASGAAAGRPAGPPDGLWITVLGPLTVHRDGQLLDLGPARQQAVLGVLALHAGSMVHRDMIIAALWGQDGPPSAVKMVQSYVSSLRGILDPGRPPRDRDGLLVSAGTSYVLQPGPGQLDLAVFGELAGQAAAARAAGDLTGACGLYAAALDTWLGEALSGLDVLHDWPERRDPHRLWAEVTGQYADTAISAGCPELSLPYLRVLTEQDQLNERAHARLMIALAGAGQQAAALQVHHELCQRLDEQLGIRPGAELAAAHERVLRQEVPGGWPPAWLAAAAGSPDGPSGMYPTASPAGPGGAGPGGAGPGGLLTARSDFRSGRSRGDL